MAWSLLCCVHLVGPCVWVLLTSPHDPGAMCPPPQTQVNSPHPHIGSVWWQSAFPGEEQGPAVVGPQEDRLPGGQAGQSWDELCREGPDKGRHPMATASL